MKASIIVVVVAATSIALFPRPAAAHCDTLDGPVVKAAQQALVSGKLAPVLAWVQAEDEAEIRAAFEQARAVRKLNPQARELADRFFYETLVRVHRAGEGAPYTGLKPAGQIDPAIAAADQAIATGSPSALVSYLNNEMHNGLHPRFMRLKALRPPADDVKAGREWVAAYVPFVHYVEAIAKIARGEAGEHSEHSEHAGHAAAAAEPAAHAGHGQAE
jgi:hypothetical protein